MLAEKYWKSFLNIPPSQVTEIVEKFLAESEIQYKATQILSSSGIKLLIYRLYSSPQHRPRGCIRIVVYFYSREKSYVEIPLTLSNLIDKLKVFKLDTCNIRTLDKYYISFIKYYDYLMNLSECSLSIIVSCAFGLPLIIFLANYMPLDLRVIAGLFLISAMPIFPRIKHPAYPYPPALALYYYKLLKKTEEELLDLASKIPSHEIPLLSSRTYKRPMLHFKVGIILWATCFVVSAFYAALYMKSL